MEPTRTVQRPQLPRTLPMWRTVIPLACVLALGGCANPWRDNYTGARLSALPDDAPVELVPSAAADVMLVKPADGWIVLGESRFTMATHTGDDGLEAFARSIGATRVLWNSHSTGWVSYQSTYRVPVTDTSRTTGTVKGPGGTSRDVDLTTTTERWEERTVDGSKEQFAHHAAFLAPAPR